MDVNSTGIYPIYPQEEYRCFVPDCEWSPCDEATSEADELIIADAATATSSRRQKAIQSFRRVYDAQIVGLSYVPFADSPDYPEFCRLFSHEMARFNESSVICWQDPFLHFAEKEGSILIDLYTDKKQMVHETHRRAIALIDRVSRTVLLDLMKYMVDLRGRPTECRAIYSESRYCLDRSICMKEYEFMFGHIRHNVLEFTRKFAQSYQLQLDRAKCRFSRECEWLISVVQVDLARR
jgi:hypothetical protein